MELRNLKELAENLRNSFASSFDPSDRKLPQSFKDRVTKINSFNLTYNDYSVVFGGSTGSLDSYIPNQLFYIAAHYNEYTKQLLYYKSKVLKVISASGFAGNLNELFASERTIAKKEDSQFFNLIKGQDINDEEIELLYKFVTDYEWWHGAKTIERNDFFNSAILSVMGMTASSNSTLAMICGYFANNPEVAYLLNEEVKNTCANIQIQTIFFGSPGTGKSFKIKDKILDGVDDNFIFRTTFHPDTDYASFVGCYKPTTMSNKTTAHKIIGYEALVEKLREYLERSYVDPKTQKSYKNVNKACVVFGFDHYDSIISMLNEDNDEHSIKSLISEAYGKDNTTYDTPLRAGMTAKETMLENIEQSSRIIYNFAPQTFTNAYVKAWLNPSENVYLVIEEINRGNCAQIFGDLFQLLDRDDNGVSEYPIKADADLTKYLQEELGTDHEGISDGKIKLPANLYILATMNTSDQSLFPMDSAFKRRWEWKYVPTSVIGDKKKTLQVESKEETVLLNREQEKKVLRLGMYEYDWSVFLEKINKCITDATHSDDKQLGFWFVKTPKDSNLINIETFVSKVIFYLWTDVFKDFGAKATNPFAFKNAEGGWVVCPFSSFFDPYTGEINLGQIHGFMYNLGIIPELEPEIQAAIEKNIVEEGNPKA